MNVLSLSGTLEIGCTILVELIVLDCHRNGSGLESWANVNFPDVFLEPKPASLQEIMKLGIMQPYFFPYIGYFDLIDKVDEWVVFDVVKYQKRSWMNRNRILHPSEGWQYISVPVNRKQSASDEIKDIVLESKTEAQKRVLGQVEHYRNHAPYFAVAIQLIEDAFDRCENELLSELNVASLSVVCNYLNIDFSYQVASRMDLDFSNVRHPGQWALEICRQTGSAHYLNPPGGREIFRPEEWERQGIKLEFSEPPALSYDTKPYRFEPDLSILDVIMWNSPDAIVEAIRGDRE